MKTLVLYASKYGCTEDCAKHLKSKLNQESRLVNLKNSGAIDLHQYDCIVIGGSIYVGKIQKEVRQFCERNLKTLITKNIMLFMCCTTPEQVNVFFKSNFPAGLLASAIQTVNFGGELRQEKMGFLDKKITAMVAKAEPNKAEKILYENIDLLARTINEKAMKA